MANKKRTLKIVEVASNALEIQFNDGETLCEFSSANDDYISSDCREKAELVLLSVNTFIWFSKITNRKDYNLWAKQYHFDKSNCPKCKYVEIRVNDNGKIKDYTFQEFGDLIFSKK